MSTVAVPSVTPSGHRGTLAILVTIGAIALLFVAAVALPYFALNETQFRGYWPRRWWLLLHITTGIVALLSGPVQLWLGLADRHLRWHRRLGTVYMTSVAISSVAAYYLALHTDFGWIFGAGLAGLASAWLVTTGLAFFAIKRQLFDQHKEWMIRSYVVTTAFITFRVLFLALQSAGVGTLQEQLGVSAWFCWAVPLLVAEAVLQGRKIARVRAI